MEKLMLVLLCTLISFAGFSSGDPSPQIFTVQGFFLKKSSVSYDLYEVTGDGDPVLIETKTSLRTYKVNLEVGKSYLIIFTKGEKSKSLHVNAEVPGEMDLDVDFHNERCASLYFDDEDHDYKVRPYIAEKDEEEK